MLLPVGVTVNVSGDIASVVMFASVYALATTVLLFKVTLMAAAGELKLTAPVASLMVPPTDCSSLNWYAGV